MVRCPLGQETNSPPAPAWTLAPIYPYPARVPEASRIEGTSDLAGAEYRRGTTAAGSYCKPGSMRHPILVMRCSDPRLRDCAPEARHSECCPRAARLTVRSLGWLSNK